MQILGKQSRCHAIKRRGHLGSLSFGSLHTAMACGPWSARMPLHAHSAERMAMLNMLSAMPGNITSSLNAFIHRPSKASMPNWSFNADANTGHAFGILMACVGTLRTSCSGAG